MRNPFNKEEKSGSQSPVREQQANNGGIAGVNKNVNTKPEEESEEEDESYLLRPRGVPVRTEGED